METSAQACPALVRHDRATVPGLLGERAEQQPGRVAFEVPGVAMLTVAQWHEHAARVAASLKARGVRPGDRVLLRFGTADWCDYAVAYVGVQRAGAVAVPLSDRAAVPQARYVAEHCAAVAVIQSPSAADDALTDGSPLTVERLLAEADADTAAPSLAAASALAQILYTSGTTGRPKGVGATHANLTFGAPSHPRRRPLGHSHHFLHAFAIGTNAAQTMLLNALTAAPTALSLPQFTPGRFARLLEQRRVGTLFVVPSLAIELLRSGALDGRDLSGVRLVGSTAAALPPAVATELAATFPAATIVNYYTSTEAAPAQTSMLFDPSRPDSLGRAVDGGLRIVTANGTSLPPGEVGEVWMRSPFPRHYYRDEAATDTTFRDGWVRMGDIGRIDADGFLYLVDRQADIVKIGAFKVSTLEVEAALFEHPDIAEAAVVGVPHPVLGSTLAAAVVPRQPGVDVGLPALRSFLADRLADQQLPTRVLVLDTLPRNEGGKVLKRALLPQLTDAAPAQEDL